MEWGPAVSLPWLPATGAIVPLEPGDLPHEAELALQALAVRVLAAPLGVFRPLERCGRVVAVAVEPSQRIFVLPDPVLPFPLVRLPGYFWSRYAGFCRTVTEFLSVAESTVWFPAEKQRRLGRLTRRAWRQAEGLVRMAAAALNGPETAYFQARLLASLAGDVAEGVGNLDSW